MNLAGLLILYFVSFGTRLEKPIFRPMDCGPICQARAAGAQSCIITGGNPQSDNQDMRLEKTRPRLAWCSVLNHEIPLSRCWFHGYHIRGDRDHIAILNGERCGP